MYDRQYCCNRRIALWCVPPIESDARESPRNVTEMRFPPCVAKNTNEHYIIEVLFTSSTVALRVINRDWFLTRTLYNIIADVYQRDILSRDRIQ